MRFISALIFSWICVTGFSQSKNAFERMGIDSEWHFGRILLKDNTQMQGYIQYNDKMALVKFRETEKDVVSEISFTDARISIIEFLSEKKEIVRRFATLPIEFSDSGMKDEMLFEVAREYSKSAVLFRNSKVDFAIRRRSYSPSPTSPISINYLTKVGIEQFYGVFIVDDAEKVTLVLRTNVLERDKGRIFERSLKPYLNKAFLKKYTSQYKKQFNGFVSENHLNLKVREDLLQALDYYNELVDQK